MGINAVKGSISEYTNKCTRFICITNYIFAVNYHSGFYFSAVLVEDEKGRPITQYDQKQ